MIRVSARFQMKEESRGVRMEVVEYEPEMAADLVPVYNHAVKGVPHCYPVDLDSFSAAIGPAVSSTEDDTRLHSESFLVARDGDRVLGFAHCAIESPKEGDDRGAIRFYWYRPGYRGVGQSLLEAAQERLLGFGVGAVVAFDQTYRYPFYGFKHAYLSEHLGHIEAILGMNGYRRIKGEVFLDWPSFGPLDVGSPGVKPTLEPEWKEGRGARPGIVMKALMDGEEIGACNCVSCGEFSESETVQDWTFTEWLGVKDEYQGKGLGRYLLTVTLNEMYEKGYRNASISTDWRNYRAFLFYSNLGYRVVDWTYCYSREFKTHVT
jgi:GNAT superfamily N-acetyltransferase